MEVGSWNPNYIILQRMLTIALICLAHLLKMQLFCYLATTWKLKVTWTWHGGSHANCNVRDDDICDKVCHQQLITQLNTEDNLFPCCYQLLMTTNVDIQPFWNPVLVKSHIPRKMVSLSSWILTLEKKFSGLLETQKTSCVPAWAPKTKRIHFPICVSYSQIYTQCTG